MSYEEFKVAYTNAFKNMMKYSPEMVGSSHYAEKMAELSEQHPEFADRVENEIAARNASSANAPRGLESTP